MIINGEYIIMISRYFDIDKYPFYIILLRVWIVRLIYLSSLFDNEYGLGLKIVV